VKSKQLTVFFLPLSFSLHFPATTLCVIIIAMNFRVAVMAPLLSKRIPSPIIQEFCGHGIAELLHMRVRATLLLVSSRLVSSYSIPLSLPLFFCP
jgi:hypothetical protein